MKIHADELSAAVKTELAAYGEEVQAGLTKSVKRAANLCLRLVRRNSPKRTGAYSTGWTKKFGREPKQPYAYVYNRDRPWLTHLLEEDHAKRNGGIVGGTHHIAAAAEQAEGQFVADVESLLGGD